MMAMTSMGRRSGLLMIQKAVGPGLGPGPEPGLGLQGEGPGQDLGPIPDLGLVLVPDLARLEEGGPIPDLAQLKGGLIPDLILLKGENPTPDPVPHLRTRTEKWTRKDVQTHTVLNQRLAMTQSLLHVPDLLVQVTSARDLLAQLNNTHMTKRATNC